MNQDAPIFLLSGFILCLVGTVALLVGNLIGAVVFLGLGLFIVAVGGGFVDKLLNVFARIWRRTRFSSSSP